MDFLVSDHREGHVLIAEIGRSPTRQSGRKKIVLARYVHNDRLVDGLNRQAFAALIASPAPAATTTSNAPAASATTPRHANSAPADRHPARLRKTGTRYDENTAWAHRQRNNYQGVPWGDAAVKVISSSLTQPLRGAGDEHNR